MRLLNLLRNAYQTAPASPGWCLVLYALFIASSFYPSNLASYHAAHLDPVAASVVSGVDTYGRFVNTAVQIGLPLLMRDPEGLAELVAVGVATTAATHGMKRLAADWEVMGVHIGRRPSGGSQNMPSGHSSMSSCAVYFVCRRYGWRFAWFMLPILILTMYARVALNAHTVSAVLAGALLGVLTAAICTTPLGGGVWGRLA